MKSHVFLWGIIVLMGQSMAVAGADTIKPWMIKIESVDKQYSEIIVNLEKSCQSFLNKVKLGVVKNLYKIDKLKKILSAPEKVETFINNRIKDIKESKNSIKSTVYQNPALDSINFIHDNKIFGEENKREETKVDFINARIYSLRQKIDSVADFCCVEGIKN